jgi:uncharacterized membrane protein
MRLQPAESDAIDRRIVAVEARTGVQVLAAVVPRSDSYVELPWKAFALGTSLAAFGVVVADSWLETWAPHLRDARSFHALAAWIADVERLLVSKGFHADASATNETTRGSTSEGQFSLRDGTGEYERVK